MVNSFDVAKLAGVSQATVSRALRGDKRVSAKTIKLVEEAAQALGYVPNAAGRALSSGRTDRIGLLVTDLNNGFYHRSIAPIADRLQALGKELVLIVDAQSDSVPARIQSLGLDGVILSTTTTDSFLPFYLRERNIPFVYFNRTMPSVPSDAAVVDSSDGYFRMLDTMLSLGHRNIGLINGPENATTGRGRALALQGYLAAKGIEIAPEKVVEGDFRVSTGIEGFRTLWQQPDRPTVILCGNDVIAFGVINEAFRQGVAIPNEVSVVGFDDIEEAAFPVYDLTTVGYDLNQLARNAVDLLLDRIKSPSEPFKERSVPSIFHHRGSLGAAL